MPYASNNKISTTPIDGGIEITDAQYRELLSAQISGRKFIIRDGNPVILSNNKRTVYSTTDGKKKEIAENDDTPEGYANAARPSEYHEWDGSQWVEDTAAKQAAEDSKRVEEIDARLKEIDAESVRPLRAINSGTDTQFDRDKLAALDSEADSLRTERVSLV